MAFNFGANTSGNKSLFGGNQSTTASTGFSFGSSNKTTQSAFTFPSNPTTTTAAFGGFGTKTTSSGLFGSTPAASAGFGAKTTASLFGGSGGFSGFGNKTTQASLFGSGFGAKTTASLFAGSTAAPAFSFPSKPDASKNLFGPAQQSGGGQSQPDNAANTLLATATALSAPLVFGDERDAIMTKWNQIQAFWGIGRGFYRKDGTHVTFSPQNHFCRFKAVGYSCLPTAKDEEGLVALIINKSEEDMRQVGESKIEEAIHKIMGSNQALKVKVDELRYVPDDKCEITIYVTEQSNAIGTVRRVPAFELHRFMQQQNIQQQLKQQICMESCIPRVKMTEEQIRNILVNPPSGIDPVLWEQAKRDNPDPKSLIPVPMLGFSQLRNRLRLQEDKLKRHQSRLDLLSKKLQNMQQEQVDIQSKVEQYKRKSLEMSHRVLQVITAQEIIRKAGYAIQLEEDQLRVHLESLYNELNAPTQFRGRLNELLSQTRLHHYTGGALVNDNLSATLDEDSLKDINKHLRKQQDGLNTLVAILRGDLNDLKLIETGLLTDEGNQQYYGLR